MTHAQADSLPKTPVGTAIVFIALTLAVVLSGLAFSSWVPTHRHSLDTNTKLDVAAPQ